jgi:hypothetical protein
MGLLGKDWNIVAITFERPDLFRVNGNRGKGGDAVKMRDNAKRHARTLYWAVFDQKGRLLEGQPGPGATLVPAAEMDRLAQEMRTSESVRSVLESLQKGESNKAARSLAREAASEEQKPPASQETPAAQVARPTARGPSTPTTATRDRTYTLIVPMGEGEEFESSLKLAQTGDQVSGSLIGPDGTEAPIDQARLEGDRISFQVTFGSAEDSLTLTFQGTRANNVIRGTLN